MSTVLDSALSSGEQVVTRISDLSAGFRERSALTNRERTVPRESMEELVDAGMARLLVPRERGGTDARIRDLIDATSAAAAGCGSTGWVAGLMGHVAHVVGRFPVEAQQAVWAAGPDVVMAGSFLGAAATAVRGGYRLSGASPFASGVNYADWVYLGGMVTHPGEAAEIRLFLLPKKDYTVLDTWHTSGMRGTGSNTVLTQDAFVPQEFTVSHEDAREGTTPGSLVNSNPTFSAPWVATGAVVFAAAMLGAAQGAYDSVIASLTNKRSPSGAKAGESEILRVDVSFVAARIETARTLIQGLADRADRDPAYTMAERATTMRDGSFAAMLLVEAIDTLLAISGTSAFASSSPVSGAWRDIHFAAAHQGLSKRATGGHYGRLVLGVDESTPPVFY